VEGVTFISALQALDRFDDLTRGFASLSPGFNMMGFQPLAAVLSAARTEWRALPA